MVFVRRSECYVVGFYRVCEKIVVLLSGWVRVLFGGYGCYEFGVGLG